MSTAVAPDARSAVSDSSDALGDMPCSGVRDAPRMDGVTAAATGSVLLLMALKSPDATLFISWPTLLAWRAHHSTKDAEADAPS